MGWIKVAETLLNPWGDDDEVKIEVYFNFILDVCHKCKYENI